MPAFPLQIPSPMFAVAWRLHPRGRIRAIRLRKSRGALEAFARRRSSPTAAAVTADMRTFCTHHADMYDFGPAAQVLYFLKDFFWFTSFVLIVLFWVELQTQVQRMQGIEKLKPYLIRALPLSPRLHPLPPPCDGAVTAPVLTRCLCPAFPVPAQSC